MLGYISSTRRKSCTACVKAKRRCDLGFPFCKRCVIKGLDCRYPNAAKATVRNAEVIIRQSTPDITPSECTSSFNDYDVSTTQIDEIHANIDPLFLQSTTPTDSCGSSPEIWQNDWSNNWKPEVSTPRVRTTAAPRICRTLLPETVLPVLLNELQVLFITDGLRTFVANMAYSGTTHFLHQNLYQDYQPQAYQDAVAISALYMARNARNQAILKNSINAKISALITNSSNWTLTEHLAAVQSLIIYQIIRLFDPSLYAQEQAVKHNALLERWSANLWKRFFDEAPTFADPHTTWIFNESLRRTVLISVFTRCGWSVFSQGGLADQVHIMARLPLTRDLGKWRCEGKEWEDRLGWEDSILSEDEELVSYGEMAKGWTHFKNVEGLDPFGKFLLAPCRGGDDPRLLM
jgi:hypothetical protein